MAGIAGVKDIKTISHIKINNGLRDCLGGCLTVTQNIRRVRIPLGPLKNENGRLGWALTMWRAHKA